MEENGPVSSLLNFFPGSSVPAKLVLTAVLGTKDMPQRSNLHFPYNPWQKRDLKKRKVNYVIKYPCRKTLLGNRRFLNVKSLLNGRVKRFMPCMATWSVLTPLAGREYRMYGFLKTIDFFKQSQGRQAALYSYLSGSCN